MDLETDRCALEFVEDNEATPHTIPHVDDNMIKDNHVDDGDGYNIKDNGSFANHNQTPCRLSTDESFDPVALTADNHIKVAIEVAQPMQSPSKSAPTTKGYGLKKWRRIKRDFVKDPSATIDMDMDSSKILKRGLSASANPTKSRQMTSPEIKHNSDSSVSQGLMMCSPSLDSGFAVEAAFAATDSENSEDRRSKSSTAASVPKGSYDLPSVLGCGHQKNQMKKLSGKTGGNSNQRGQQRKARLESSKKARGGERVKIDKENSHSSMESDSRSSNFFFVQGPFSVTSNGNQSEKSINYDGEDSDEVHEGEHQISEEVPTAYGKENLATHFSWEAKEEKSENDRPSPNQDPLVKSILALQSVQEAFENEIQRLGEIGKEPTSLLDDLVNNNCVPVDSNFAYQEIHETRSSDQLASTDIRKISSGSLETQVFILTQKVKYLESELEEARAVLKARESRISELVSVNSSRSGKEELESTTELQQDKSRDLEFDLEGLFQLKIEAEIEFLALTGAIQKLRVTMGNQITLFEEETLSSWEQAEMLSKGAMLKKQEELEKYRGDVLGIDEEVPKMKRSVCKITSCFFAQLVFLVLVLWFFVLQLSPHSGVAAPT